VTNTNHLAITKIRLSQIINSKWQPVTDYIEARPD
jgi:hypothetical protein